MLELTRSPPWQGPTPVGTVLVSSLRLPFQRLRSDCGAGAAATAARAAAASDTTDRPGVLRTNGGSPAVLAARVRRSRRRLVPRAGRHSRERRCPSRARLPFAASSATRRGKCRAPGSPVRDRRRAVGSGVPWREDTSCVTTSRGASGTSAHGRYRADRDRADPVPILSCAGRCAGQLRRRRPRTLSCGWRCRGGRSPPSWRTYHLRAAHGAIEFRLAPLAPDRVAGTRAPGAHDT